jgi:hypothetical protein
MQRNMSALLLDMSYALEDERPTFNQAWNSVRHIVFLKS